MLFSTRFGITALSKVALAMLLLCAISFPAAGTPGASPLAARLDQIQHNATSPPPWPDVTLKAGEVNQYFAGEGASTLPRGVSHLVVGSRPGWVAGSAEIDFDALARRKGANPLLGLLFTGTHRVGAQARVVSVSAPAARLYIESVSLDGQRIPDSLIDFALETFVHARHPEIGREFAVKLPRHVKSVAVGNDQVTLHY